jgi:hypothetical protein
MMTAPCGHTAHERSRSWLRVVGRCSAGDGPESHSGAPLVQLLAVFNGPRLEWSGAIRAALGDGWMAVLWFVFTALVLRRENARLNRNGAPPAG